MGTLFKEIVAPEYPDYRPIRLEFGDIIHDLDSFDTVKRSVGTGFMVTWLVSLHADLPVPRYYPTQPTGRLAAISSVNSTTTSQTHASWSANSLGL